MLWVWLDAKPSCCWGNVGTKFRGCRPTPWSEAFRVQEEPWRDCNMLALAHCKATGMATWRWLGQIFRGSFYTFQSQANLGVAIPGLWENGSVTNIEFSTFPTHRNIVFTLMLRLPGFFAVLQAGRWIVVKPWIWRGSSRARFFPCRFC